MLWKKESNRSDAMYVDVYASVQGEDLSFDKLIGVIQAKEGYPRSTLNKNDAVSLHKRQMGNQLFAQGNWKNAMELYNESLCYAENGSKNISLAYASRSACFLKLKMYKKCLIDIELAKDSGYPSDLMSKLDRRQEECLTTMEEDAQPVKFGSKLSFKADKNFPCVAC